MKLCVIGAGVLGSYHIEKALKNLDFEVSGFYDISEERRERASKKFGIPAETDVDKLFARSDAAIIATPASTHSDIVLHALEKGCHVLVEKPLADSCVEGEKMVACAERNHRVLHVGHSEAFNPAFLKLQAHCTKPRFMEIHRLATFSPRGIDVSVVFDLMIHDLHLMERLLHWDTPEENGISAAGVAVVSPGIDLANVRLSFPSGCIVNCTSSRISVSRMRKIRVFQEGAYFSADLDSREIVCCELSGESTEKGLPVSTTREVLDPTDALEQEQAAFTASIKNPVQQTKGTTGSEALQVLRVADTIMQRLKAFKNR